MHVVLVEFVIRPEHAPAFRERVLQQAKDSLELEPNCRQFDVSSAPEAANSFVLYELYDATEDFLAHLETAHFKAFDAEVADWIEKKTVRQLSLVKPQPSGGAG